MKKAAVNTSRNPNSLSKLGLGCAYNSVNMMNMMVRLLKDTQT